MRAENLAAVEYDGPKASMSRNNGIIMVWLHVQQVITGVNTGKQKVEKTLLNGHRGLKAVKLIYQCLRRKGLCLQGEYCKINMSCSCSCLLLYFDHFPQILTNTRLST